MGKNLARRKTKSRISVHRPPLNLVLAFVIPIVILIIIYMIRGVYPFGEKCFLRSDMYHQYAPFHAAFMDKIKNGESLFYSWDIGMGVNFTALYAYYLATPLNWILFFIPQTSLIEFMSIFIFVKVGLCGVTFTHYINKHFHTQNPVIAGISLFYSLSAFICAYSWNLMWLDCIWLFPLILLGLERLVKEKRCFLYCIALGICIFTNYYISIMVCIFCFIYFLYLLLTQKQQAQPWWKSGLMFGLYSLLAGGFAACLLIPEMYALQLTASGDMNFPKTLSRYFSILEMISRQIMMVEPAVFSAHEPNIYSGMMVFLFVPLYALNQRVSTREKIGKFLLLFLFYLSFNLNIPNYIWHGLHFPNSLPCRQSFIFTFLILTMVYEGMRDLKSYKSRELVWTMIGGIALLLLLEQTFEDKDKYPYYIVYISGFILALYGMLACAYRSETMPKRLAFSLFMILAVTEAMINTTDTSVNVTGRTSYLSDNKAISAMLDRIEDTDFYRVEKLKRRTKNDAAWHHYHGISLFSSTANAGVGDFLSAFGGENSTNSYAYYGATPLEEAIFSVRYVLSKDELTDTRLRVQEDSEDGEYLYRNIYTLPLAFMLPNRVEEQWALEDKNPFTVQNNFANLATDVSPLFSPIAYSVTGNALTFIVDSDQHVYAHVKSKGESFTVTYQTEESEKEPYTKKFTGVKQKYTFDLGYVKAGTTVTVTATDEENIDAEVYTLLVDNFITMYEILIDGGMAIKSYDDTHVSGTVTAKEDGTLFTSIPYEKGWTVKVDGNKVETHPFQDAFLAIPLSAGAHTLEFSFQPYGLNLGLAISVFSLLIFIGIVYFYWKKGAFSKETIASHAYQKEQDTDMDWNKPEEIEEDKKEDAKEKGKEITQTK